MILFFFFFSSRRRHTRLQGDWSSDVCSSDLSQRLIELTMPDLQALLGVRAKPVFQHTAFYPQDRKSTRLNSSHLVISYAVFCLKKKKSITPSPLSPSAGTSHTSSALARVSRL